MPTLTTKTFGIYEGASKQSQDSTPRILPRRDHVPGFDIPGSATVKDLKATDFDHVSLIPKMPNKQKG